MCVWGGGGGGGGGGKGITVYTLSKSWGGEGIPICMDIGATWGPHLYFIETVTAGLIKPKTLVSPSHVDMLLAIYTMMFVEQV